MTRREVIISSSYEAAGLRMQGLECIVVPKRHGRDVEYVFEDNEALRNAQRQLDQDLELQEYIAVHRRLKREGREKLKELRKVTETATADE